MTQPTIVLAGVTGALGTRIARALRERGARVVAPVRPGTAAARLDALRGVGAEPVAIDLAPATVDALAGICAGAHCVVSALNGLEGTILEAQAALLDAAVKAGVPRFIPSDYSIDFTRLPPGANRNFDLRRAFHTRLETADIAATSIYNGAFADMLTGQAPLVLFPLKRVLYFGDKRATPDLPLDFTTMDDTAAFTAAAALDAATPRALHVAGSRVSVNDLAAIMGGLTGKRHGLLRAGGLQRLDAFIRIARRLAPGKGQVFPAWQGMQYLRSMFDGRASRLPLDNDRYPDLRWTGVRDVLAGAVAGAGKEA